MAKVVLSVPDISCEHCERTIKEALAPIDGVREVSVDIGARRVDVDYDDRVLSVNQMKEILREEDYPVESATTA